MNRYYDEEEYNIPGSNPCLYSNIKVLREEARLTIEDLAEKMEVSSEVIKLWESNKAVPSYYEIEKLCKYLRISQYDIMTRDILDERNKADKKLRSSSERKNYDWYYGSKKIVTLNLVYLIGMPLLYIFFVFFWHLVPIDLSLFVSIISIFGNAFNYIIAYVGCALISGWIIAITFMIKIRYRFKFWHLLFISFYVTVVELVGLIGTIPYYIYTLIKLITLKGRNHK